MLGANSFELRCYRFDLTFFLSSSSSFFFGGGGAEGGIDRFTECTHVARDVTVTCVTGPEDKREKG